MSAQHLEPKEQKNVRRTAPDALQRTPTGTSSPVAQTGYGDVQAALSGDTPLPQSQRQALLRSVGRVGGNRRVQRVVESLKRVPDVPRPPRSAPGTTGGVVQRTPGVQVLRGRLRVVCEMPTVDLYLDDVRSAVREWVVDRQVQSSDEITPDTVTRAIHGRIARIHRGGVSPSEGTAYVYRIVTRLDTSVGRPQVDVTLVSPRPSRPGAESSAAAEEQPRAQGGIRSLRPGRPGTSGGERQPTATEEAAAEEQIDVGSLQVNVQGAEPATLEEVLADLTLRLERLPDQPTQRDAVAVHQPIQAMLRAAPSGRQRQVGEFIRLSLNEQLTERLRAVLSPLNQRTLATLGIPPLEGQRLWRIEGNQVQLDRPINHVTRDGSLQQTRTLRIGMTTFLSRDGGLRSAHVIRSIDAQGITVERYRFHQQTRQLVGQHSQSWALDRLGTEISIQQNQYLTFWQPIATWVAIISTIVLTAGTSSVVGAGAATASELGVSAATHSLLTCLTSGLSAAIGNYIQRHVGEAARGAQEGRVGRFWESPQYNFERHLQSFLYDFVTGAASNRLGRIGSTGQADEFATLFWRQLSTRTQAQLIIGFVLRRLQETLASVNMSLVSLGRDLLQARTEEQRQRAVRTFRASATRALTEGFVRSLVSNTVR